MREDSFPHIRIQLKTPGFPLTSWCVSCQATEQGCMWMWILYHLLYSGRTGKEGMENASLKVTVIWCLGCSHGKAIVCVWSSQGRKQSARKQHLAFQGSVWGFCCFFLSGNVLRACNSPCLLAISVCCYIFPSSTDYSQQKSSCKFHWSNVFSS